jgi:hypothetical protein
VFTLDTRLDLDAFLGLSMKFGELFEGIADLAEWFEKY